MSDTSDRPRKKKKKKKSNRGLIIGLCAGGAALVIAIIVLILLLSGGGEAPKKGDGPAAKLDPLAPPVKKVEPGPLVVVGGKTRLGKYIRVLAKTEAEFVLKNLGLAYINFNDTVKRGPNNQKELEPFYERDNRVTQSLDDKEGWLTFIYGSSPRSMVDGTSRTILAYERGPEDGFRYVLLGDGSFTQMSEEDFAKAPKAKGK